MQGEGDPSIDAINEVMIHGRAATFFGSQLTAEKADMKSLIWPRCPANV